MGKTPSPRLRIFLAEDDRELRQLISESLRRDGHFVLEASDGIALVRDLGHAFWQGCEDSVPSLIITDVRMPGASGLRVLAELGAQPWCPAFMVITGFGDQELHAEARALGALQIFDKPFDLDRLRAEVRAFAGRRASGRGVADGLGVATCR